MKEMEKMKKESAQKNILIELFYAFCVVLTFFSCELNTTTQTVTHSKGTREFTEKIPSNIETENRKWNILVYMSADNNLESSALEDICEMESARFNSEEIAVFVLIDRSSAYDTSENNWSGTRLYKIKSNRTSEEKNMISQEIECPTLGLFQNQAVELDLSSGYVLSKCLSFLIEKFPAENYGLIMWGHGTGWRNDDCGMIDANSDFQKSSISKGFAFDETSKTYMTLKQLGVALKNGLSGRRLSFLGFDTCFGGELEIMYELKNYTDYCVASAGLVMASGWDYTKIMETFTRCNEKSPKELCLCVVEQFKKVYANTKKASIVAIDMSSVEDYFLSFDEFCKESANLIESKQTRNEVIGILYSNKDCETVKYTYGAENSDVYVDIFSMVSALKKYFGSSLNDVYNDYEMNKRKTCVSFWSSESVYGGLGVYFGTLTSSGLLSTSLPAMYVKDKTYDQIAFVKESVGYVPTMDENKSLLDKLFNAKYN